MIEHLQYVIQNEVEKALHVDRYDHEISAIAQLIGCTVFEPGDFYDAENIDIVNSLPEDMRKRLGGIVLSVQYLKHKKELFLGEIENMCRLSEAMTMSNDFRRRSKHGSGYMRIELERTSDQGDFSGNIRYRFSLGFSEESVHFGGTEALVDMCRHILLEQVTYAGELVVVRIDGDDVGERIVLVDGSTIYVTGSIDDDLVTGKPFSLQYDLRGATITLDGCYMRKKSEAGINMITFTKEKSSAMENLE